MADPKEPKRPAIPYNKPGSPLPRLWKAEPDEETEDEAASRKKSKKAKPETSAEPARPSVKAKKKAKDGKAAKAKDGEAKGVLKEETPNLDTYETRQRVRIAIGSVLFLVFLLVGYGGYRFFSGGKSEEPIPDEMLAVPGTSGTPRERSEQEARIYYDRARDVAKNGKTELAVRILKKVTTSYPSTQASFEAKEALERSKQNPPLPLFLDRPAVIASQEQQPSAPPPKPPDRVVDATKSAVASTVGASANLVPPVNPAESPKAPGPVLMNSPGQSVAPEATASKPLPKGFHLQPGSAVDPSGWPRVIVGDRDGAPMVLVSGARFIQGRDESDPVEAPAHQVALGTYYIDQHEVTVRQFNLFQKEAGRRHERVKALAKDPIVSAAEADEERPVVLVTAREASDYAYWAGKRLPTEAQWEAAARTPDGRIFPWGPDQPAWSKPRTSRQIDPVMSFPSDVSPYGAFDLAGNAWEWTKDWFDTKYYQQFRNTVADNPTGPLNRPRSAMLVVKGSSKEWLVSKREGLRFDSRLPYLGFRCALQVEGPGNAFEPPPDANAQPGAPPAAGGSTVPF